MPTPTNITDETWDQLCQYLKPLEHLTHEQIQTAKHMLHHGIMRQLLRDIWQIDNAKQDPRDALLQLIDPKAINRDYAGNTITCNIQTPYWREWYPGLDNDELILGDVLDLLPGFTADQVPAMVRLFENPQSPIALAGACTLEQHDAIHILIGRGLINQDEAFVLGFTAGTTKTNDEREAEAYRLALSSYAEPYTIQGRDTLAFDLGLKAGRLSQAHNIHLIDVAASRDQSLGQLRQQLNIDTKTLREFYQLEQRIIPNTPASIRLPI